MYRSLMLFSESTMAQNRRNRIHMILLLSAGIAVLSACSTVPERRGSDDTLLVVPVTFHQNRGGAPDVGYLEIQLTRQGVSEPKEWLGFQSMSPFAIHEGLAPGRYQVEAVRGNYGGKWAGVTLDGELRAEFVLEGSGITVAPIELHYHSRYGNIVTHGGRLVSHVVYFSVERTARETYDAVTDRLARDPDTEDWKILPHY